MDEKCKSQKSFLTLSRKDFIKLGAFLGVAGLGGLTLVGCSEPKAPAPAPGAGAVQDDEKDQLISKDAAEWVPSATPRLPRKYRWEPLAPEMKAPSTGLTLSTVGLGVSVQDRFLREFERRTGHKAQGKVASLTAMITEWLGGGYRNYTTNETNACRNEALWSAGLLEPIPVEKIIPWKYARDLFTNPNAVGNDPEGWLLRETWVDPKTQKEFRLVPQFYNCDSIGYRVDLVYEEPKSWGAMFDPRYKGKVAILNDSILTMGWVAGYLKAKGLANINKSQNLTRPEVDAVIKFLIDQKRNGQFRVLWDDYGQAVNLLASGEVWLADVWNPVVEDVKKLGAPCKYAFVEEGFIAWFHGVAVAKDTKNMDAAIDYINFCLEGWWGAQVASQGYYSPTTCCEEYLKLSKNSDPEGKYNDFQWWYLGGADPGPKAGWPINGRDTGSYNTRYANIMHWYGWPDEVDYYATKWNDFLSA